jgi:hypothetical protein
MSRPAIPAGLPAFSANSQVCSVFRGIELTSASVPVDYFSIPGLTVAQKPSFGCGQPSRVTSKARGGVGSQKAAAAGYSWCNSRVNAFLEKIYQASLIKSRE